MKNVGFPMKISPEVASALQKGFPVVALESTIISHGMPFPKNYETAKEVETVVRSNGAVPATIAILDGIIHIGLQDQDLLKLAKLGLKCRKCSRRDLAACIAEKGNGATTVAGTMYCANLAGIKVFVTGGIGGVHRGAEQTMDISADLNELGKTPVAVVCAGVKSILDIPKTLEYLETQGVNVITVGQDELPAFYIPHSGVKSPQQLDTPLQCAELIYSSNRIGMQSGMVFAVPVPSYQAANNEEITKAIDKSLREVKEKSISGRDITPYLLLRISELTEGRSLTANIALVKNNASVGSKIAVEYSKLMRLSGLPVSGQLLSSTSPPPKTCSSSPQTSSSRSSAVKIPAPVIIGGAMVDVMAFPHNTNGIKIGTSNPGVVKRNFGGVGRNIAEVLGHLRCSPIFITTVGSDSVGNALIQHAKAAGINTQCIQQVDGRRTGTYVAIFDENNDLHAGVCDAAILKNTMDIPFLNRYRDFISSSSIVICDGNITAVSLRYIMNVCNKHNIPLWYEPVSVDKAIKCVENKRLDRVTYISPNEDELFALCEATDCPESSRSLKIKSLKTKVMWLLQAGATNVIVTLGSNGTLVGQQTSEKKIKINHIPTNEVPSSQIENTSGAGDSFVGGCIYGLLHGKDLLESSKIGMCAARAALFSTAPINKDVLRYVKRVSML